MSLVVRVNDLALRIATEFKTVRTEITSLVGSLSSLTTANKTNVVAAMNEINAKPAGVNQLAQLTDVTLSAPATAHVLRYNGTTWVNVLGTTYYEVAGAALTAENNAKAASQPLDSDLTALAALTTTSYGRAFNTLADQTALMALLSAASTTVPGKIALATNAEGIAGTDPSKAVTSSVLAAVFTDRIDTNVALGASNVKVPSQAAVKAYADALIGANDAMVYKGIISASSNPNYPAADAGWTYKISTAGKIGGASGVNVEVGDTIMCTLDGSAAGTQAVVGANWNIAQTNLDGAVIGPVSSVNGNFASFSGTGGKVIADSGISTDNDSALAANSSTRVPTQAAVRAYAQPLDADLTAIAGLTSAADRLPYFTGAGTAAVATFTAAGRSLVAGVDAAAQRTTLSVYSQTEIGVPETDFNATFTAGLV